MAATVNLRAFPFSEQLDCPHCHKPITLYDSTGSEYVVCPSCNYYFKFANGILHQQEHIAPIKYQPALEIGKQGILKGTPYKVLAYLEKKEQATHYEWREYMLYNYTKGYAFLAEFDGHWNYIAGIQHFPQVDNARVLGSTASMDGVDYLEYNRYTPVITAMLGEFDWDVYRERISAREFINPPMMLVREKNKQNESVIDWYLGEYCEPEEIAAAFNVPVGDFVERVDIGENQPNPYKKRFQQSLRISIAALVIAIIIQIVFGTLRQTQVIMNKDVAIALPPAPRADSAKHDSLAAVAGIFGQSNNGNFEYQSLRTSSFKIFSGPAPVEIEINAPVDNTWFEATIELVNEKDNQTWDVTKEVEYYHGYEDGESWSEGGTSGSVTVDDIPAGTYHINIYPYAGSTGLGQMNIKVTANIMLWQNILITFLLLCLYPLFCWYFQRRYEVNRWMVSDFSPYKTTTSSDD